MANESSATRRKELLDVLSDIKSRVTDRLGDAEFPLPQFIIVGRQSVGKSRLIEALAGETFNFVSGSLGSRRPTVLEFRNVSSHPSSKWFHKKDNRWMEEPRTRVMEIVSDAHNSLGRSVSSMPVYLRLESPDCFDMQVVDLPGFRDYANDADAQKLKDDIDTMVKEYMRDPRNVIICVEQAGDSANMSTLHTSRTIDPGFTRTILVRNKLDRYYRDLTATNVNKWLDGNDDLPRGLVKFALTLPHWETDAAEPPSFVALRSKFSDEDLQELRARGASQKSTNTIGFANFSSFMEEKVERMFADAVNPVQKRLQDLVVETGKQIDTNKERLEHTHRGQRLNAIRSAGTCFGNALQHVLEGQVELESGRMTLDEELRKFHADMQGRADMALLPMEVLSLDSYIERLFDTVKVPAAGIAVNGGAQLRRLVFEVEVFLRMGELERVPSEQEVVQGRGVSMTSLTWREVVVKLLCQVAHVPMRQRVNYVAHRLGWFFKSQKDLTLQFMLAIAGGAESKMYSKLMVSSGRFIDSDPTVKRLVYDAFDAAVDKQIKEFTALYESTLAATFMNPWVFLRRASVSTEDVGSVFDHANQPELPCLDEALTRVTDEVNRRSGIENRINSWLGNLPLEATAESPISNQVICLVVQVYAHIRAHVADQMELFGDSFFKLPMLRKLDEAMGKMEMGEAEAATFEQQHTHLAAEGERLTTEQQEVRLCLDRLRAFVAKTKARDGL